MRILNTSLFLVLILTGCSQFKTGTITTETVIVPEHTASYSVSSFELDDGSTVVLPTELPQAFSAAELLAEPFSDFGGDIVFLVTDNGRVLKSLVLKATPSQAGSLPLEELTFTLQVPGILNANGEVTGQMALSSPALLTANGGPLETDTTLGFSYSAIGVMSTTGVYDLSMGMSPVAFPVGFAGLNIFFDLLPKATLTEKWPKLDDKMKERLATLISHRHYQRALNELKEWLEGRKVDVDDDIVFKLFGTGEGISLESNGRIETTFGTGAFSSPGKFLSSFLHELKHAKQYKQNPIPPTNERELEAWLQECENLSNTGLDRDRGQMKIIKKRVREFYKKVRAATPLPANMKSYYKRSKACVMYINKLMSP